MEARAMEQRWPVKAEYRDAVLKRNMRIILSPNSTERAVSAASKVILAAESQNQSDEHKVVDVNLATRHDQLSGIAADLGIEIGVISNAESESGGSLASVAEPGVEVVRSNGAGHGRDSEAESPQ
jgi:hypothetical protein